MTISDRTKLEKIANDIIQYANSKENPSATVADILTSISINSMNEERDSWEIALNVLGPKTKEKILRARYNDESIGNE